MKIYFAGSIRAGRDDKELYLQIIQHLSRFGTVLTEHVGDQKLTLKGEDGPSDTWIYNRDMSWLKECDIVVAEVTKPSLGVGYEIGIAQEMGKKIVCFFRQNQNKVLSAMLNGNEGLQVVNYSSIDELKHEINRIFNDVKDNKGGK